MSSSPDFNPFLRVERDEGGKSKHYVIHTREPRFSMELLPDAEAPDKVGRGVIKRICLPNSCIGDYTKYSKLMTAAQEFFQQSFNDPVPKGAIRRLSV